MKNPKYRAYKPVMVTDDIFIWQQDSFDNTVGAWTDADIDKCIASLQSCAPLERITTIQARLDSLKITTPAIKLHADAIRAIYAGLGNHHSVTLAELRRLDEAERLWEKIMVLRDIMPKFITGAAVSAGGTKGGIIRGKQRSREKAKGDEIETIGGERGLVSDTIKMLALETDQMDDYLNIKDDLWNKLIGILDGLGNAKEVYDKSGEPLRIDYWDNNGKPGQVTFKSFRTIIYEERRGRKI